MPIALCRRVMSCLVGMFAIVISPGALDDEYGGSLILITESESAPLYAFIACTLFASKCFHDRTFFAAAAVARMLTLELLGSEHNVSLWQWSDLSWLMIIRSISCLISVILATIGSVV